MLVLPFSNSLLIICGINQRPVSKSMFAVFITVLSSACFHYPCTAWLILTWTVPGVWYQSYDWHQSLMKTFLKALFLHSVASKLFDYIRGARWLSGRVSDSGARGRGFETYRRRVVSLSKTLYSPKVLVNYPGSGGSVPTWLKNCWLGR